MSIAREVVDRLTEAVVAEDLEEATSYYASSAVLVAPEGTFKGRDQIREFFRGWFDPLSDMSFEITTKTAWGSQTLDEWSISATNSGDLELPTGETVPATGTRVTVRGADVCTVDDRLIVEHHVYYDQVEFLGQLGLLPE